MVGAGPAKLRGLHISAEQAGRAEDVIALAATEFVHTPTLLMVRGQMKRSHSTGIRLASRPASGEVFAAAVRRPPFEAGQAVARGQRRCSASPERGPGLADAPWASALPVLLSTGEVADLIRTTRRAIYAMVERQQLPGLVRIGRRVLVRRDELLRWLDERRAA